MITEFRHLAICANLIAHRPVAVAASKIGDEFPHNLSLISDKSTQNCSASGIFFPVYVITKKGKVRCFSCYGLKIYMRTKPIIILALLLVIAAGFLRFRPDRLFVDAKEEVREPPRLSAGMSELYMSGQIILAEGEFHNLARTGAGHAKIITDNQGRRFLRFIEFETAPGKDLMVCLMPNASIDKNSKAQLLRYSIALLKEIMGDQLYELPPQIDLSQYGEVAIWSRYSGITYTSARLHHR